MRNGPILLVAALLFAGCTQQGTTNDTTTGQGIAVGEPNGPSMGTLIPPAHAENTSAGLHLVGDQDVSGMPQGGQVHFTYTATNVGTDAVTWGGCYRPYSFVLRDNSGRELGLTTATFQCLGFTEDPFPANQKMDFSMIWNGTYADGEHYVQAPDGHYNLTATFTVHRADKVAAVSVTLPVNILEEHIVR